MDLQKILSDIAQGHMKKIYLFYGEETYLLEKIKKDICRHILGSEGGELNFVSLSNNPSALQIMQVIDETPFLGGNRVIWISQSKLFQDGRRGKQGEDMEAEENTEDVAEASDDKGIEGLIKGMERLEEGSCLVFSVVCKKGKSGYKEIGKRRKLYKWVDKYGDAVELAPVLPRDVGPWLQKFLKEKQCAMGQPAKEYFMSILNMMPQVSLGFLDMELEKLALYAGENKAITVDQVKAILSNIPEVSAFAMIEAISEQRLEQALYLLRQQLDHGESALKIAALLLRQVRMLWRALLMKRRGISGRNMAEGLGVPPFIAERVARQAERFSVGMLQKSFLFLADFDKNIKLGKTQDEMLEQLIVELCRKK